MAQVCPYRYHLSAWRCTVFAGHGGRFIPNRGDDAHGRCPTHLHCRMVYSVLVVDDDPRFRDAFAEAVGSAPDLCLAGVAADLPEALQLLDALKPDVLLVDLALPSGNGIELIRYANTYLPQCHSMVVSVFDDDESILRCIQAGPPVICSKTRGKST